MVKTGQVWSGLIVCRDATGALATPSVGPAGALYVDGAVNGASVTVSGANPYKWTVTLPALTAGQCVSMYITATIATIATAAVVAEDVADTSLASDLAATLGVAGAGLTALPAVTLAGTQGAVTFGQVKIAANVASQGALDIYNAHASGYGQYVHGGNYAQFNNGLAVGQYNNGGTYGQYNAGNTAQRNDGVAYGQLNGGAQAIVGNITGDITGDLSGSVTGTVGGIAGTLTTIDALWAKVQKWLRLALRKDTAVAADHATELAEINANGGSGAGAYASTTDSQEAARDAVAALPAVSAIADAVADEILSGHVIAGSVGAALNRIGTGEITVVAPVATSGDVSIDQGYDYYAADGRGLSWTNSESTWPDLTDATAELLVGGLEVACAITNPTGPATIAAELSATETGSLSVGVHRFEIPVTLANTHLILLIRGNLVVS